MSQTVIIIFNEKKEPFFSQIDICFIFVLAITKYIPLIVKRANTYMQHLTALTFRYGSHSQSDSDLEVVNSSS